MGIFREKAENFVKFHTQENRIAELERQVAKQKDLNKALLVYIDADISALWMDPAKELAAALREALK